MSGPSLPTPYSWGSRVPSALSPAPVAAYLCLSHKTAGPTRTSPPHPTPAAPLSWVSLWALSRQPSTQCWLPRSPHPFPQEEESSTPPHSQVTPKALQLCTAPGRAL